MIDTHCHLDACDDPDGAAATADLEALVSIGTTAPRCHTILALAERYPHVYAAVGIHPTEAESVTAEVRAEIERLARHPKVVGIGETGFDDYWDAATPGAQQESFVWQAELARALDKPLILHVRDKQNRESASLMAARMIREASWPKGILHCFNGHAELLAAGLELGWMVSFAGNVTYKNATDIQAAAKQVPAERLLLETDSPYLTPAPKRGARNVPANVRHTATFVADLRQMSVEQLEHITDTNARRIYGL